MSHTTIYRTAVTMWSTAAIEVLPWPTSTIANWDDELSQFVTISASTTGSSEISSKSTTEVSTTTASSSSLEVTTGKTPSASPSLSTPPESPSSSSSPASSRSSGLSSGAKIGIGVGSAAGVFLVATLAYLCWKVHANHERAPHQHESTPTSYATGSVLVNGQTPSSFHIKSPNLSFSPFGHTASEGDPTGDPTLNYPPNHHRHELDTSTDG
ncbi:hypothetical protein GGR57DRAFT_496753 [Xylariaceae sp. FL1272]|nr:hypothetical protein GGR57DRAFT_496753 [Xylariaceae sp. FL1272]